MHLKIQHSFGHLPQKLINTIIYDAEEYILQKLIERFKKNNFKKKPPKMKICVDYRQINCPLILLKNPSFLKF